MLDSGYRCSIPACEVSANLDIDHIVEWSVVREHDYSNLIVLCPNHHAMKVSGSRPRSLDAGALRMIKQNQLKLSGRYGDVERRVIEHFVRNPEATTVTLPGDFDVLLMNLLDLNLLEKVFGGEGTALLQYSDLDADPEPTNSHTMRQVYRLTADGRSAVDAVREVREISAAY